MTPYEKANSARVALVGAYAGLIADLESAVLRLMTSTIPDLAAAGTPVEHVGGPRLRPYEEALDRALMAL